MKICLINPPNSYELIGNDPVIIKDQQGVYPPLGILYIAACLRDAGNHEVHVIDSQADELTHAQLAQQLFELKPDVVGLTAMTFTLVDCKLTIQEIRKRFDPLIVVGGPHTAIYPSECFNKDGLAADFVVVGEGELTFQRLLDDIEQGRIKRYSSINERTYRQKDFIQDLNLLPFPARELTHIDNYYSVLAYDTPTSTAFSSRGCPFSCFTGDTLVLTETLKWKRIDSLRKGDGIVGIKEVTSKRTKYYNGKVTHIFPVHEEEVYEIKTEHGTIKATADHPFLTTHKRWVPVSKLLGKNVRFLAEPQEYVEENYDYKKGYLCGTLKSDGCFKKYPRGKHYRYWCALLGDFEMMDVAMAYSNDLGVPFHRANFSSKRFYNCHSIVKTNKRAHFEQIERWFDEEHSEEFKRGFIAGYFDGDGSWTSLPKIHCKDIEPLNKLASILSEKNFITKIYQREDNKQFSLVILGGIREGLRFAFYYQPKVLRKLAYWNRHPQVYGQSKVLSVKPLGKSTVYNLETSISTYVANGYVVHNCAYCDRPALGKGFRAMNARRVVDELEDCQKKGIKEMFYYDDTFSVSMKRVDEICDEIIRRNIHMKWDIRTRVNVVTEALLEKMARAGCDRIHFGVESGNPRVVKEMNKGTSIQQVEDAFRLCKKYKIKTLAYFMLGNPTETFEDVKDTLRLSQKIKPDFMQMTILSPFPATKYYLEAMQNNVISVDVWKNYANTINDDFRPPLWTQPGGIYTREELEKQMRWFYGQFYLQPKFIFDRIKEVRNLGQFKRYASAGLSLLSMTLIPEKKLKDSWGLRNATNTANSARPESAVSII